MIKNYFRVALRALLKNKVFSLINVLGLAIGISSSLVIYLLVNYHFTFDKFEDDNARIYRAVSKFSFSGEVYYNSGITSPMAGAVKKELTGLDAVVPFRTWDGSAKVSIPKHNSSELQVFKKQEEIIFAGDDYFNLMGYQWLAGSVKNAVSEPYQTVLTEERAKLYFPHLTPAEIIGEQVRFNDTVLTTVSGIVKSIRQNTDFSFQAFVSMATLEKTSLKPHDFDQWNNTNGASQLLLKLAPGTSTTQIEKGMYDLYDKYRHKEADDHSKVELLLQPLNDIHFNSDYGGYSKPLANKPILYSLLAVALFLLLLGCINFINLTTAQATQRAKEIGVRKTMGSTKGQLIFQFLSETFLLTFIATIVSVLLTPLILQSFSDFIPKELHFNILEQPSIVVFLLLLMIVVTVLSGFYPAMVLSGYKPVLVLKNQLYSGSGKTRQVWLRRSLTISQFVIAQVFIMATILVGKQIHYTLNKDLGFKKDAIVYLNTNYYDTVASHKTVLMEKLKAIPEIKMVSMSTAPPSSGNTWSGTVKYKDGKKEVEADVQFKYTDSNYIKLFNLKLLAGKGVAQTDTVNSFVINEAYAKILGFQQPQQAIGKMLEWSDRQVPITGVLANFHQRSLHEPIKPLAMGSWSGTERTINILLQPRTAGGDNWKTAISKIETAWKEVYPEDDFEYSFLDAEIAKFYDQEKNISGLLKWSTGLAVFISCLGLLGLVMYTTTQRTKEIGVRKVLGASVLQIIQLIAKDFILLVLLAFIIAAPLAWIGMHKWLQNFAYRTDISLWIFALAGALMILVALLTLAIQTIKAAIANPVKSLRTE
ncbi:ABC transporter permease [Ferruginibacter sp.]